MYKKVVVLDADLAGATKTELFATVSLSVLLKIHTSSVCRIGWLFAY